MSEGAIVSYILPEIEYSGYEAFVGMIMYVRQIMKQLFEPNQIIKINE